MSKLKYRLTVKGQGSTDVQIRHELDYLVPIVRGDYDNDWNESTKRADLMQAIADQKSLNFQKCSESTGDKFWETRHKSKTVIPMVKIATSDNGRSYQYLLYDVEIFPPLFVQGHAEYKYQSVNLKFESIDMPSVF